MIINVLSDKPRMTIKSQHTLADLKKVMKYAPNVLQLADDKGNVVYEVMISGNGYGSIGNIGAEFAPTAGNDGFARIVVDLPECDNVEKYVADTYGIALMRLKEIDDAISSEMGAINEKYAAICNMINVTE